MDAAVTQLAVVEVGFLCAFTCQLGYSGYGFAVAFVVLDFLFKDFCYVRIAVQIIVNFGFDEVTDKFVYADTAVWFHGERTEFDFCLTFKLRLLHIDCNCSNDSTANVGVFVVLLVELLDGACYMLLECGLVCTSLNGVLAVDERVVLFTILLIGVGKGYLYIFSLEVDDGVESRSVHGVGQQVFQSVAGDDTASVVVYLKSCVQIGVIAEHGLHELRLELIVEEESVVGFKMDVCTCLVHVGHIFPWQVVGLVAFQLSFLELGNTNFAFTITAYFKMA